MSRAAELYNKHIHCSRGSNHPHAVFGIDSLCLFFSLFFYFSRFLSLFASFEGFSVSLLLLLLISFLDIEFVMLGAPTPRPPWVPHLSLFWELFVQFLLYYLGAPGKTLHILILRFIGYHMKNYAHFRAYSYVFNR